MATANDRPRDSLRVQSVERAAVLLRAVAEATGPASSATALAETVGLNRTTTWRILSTLEHHSLVVHDKETGGYTLGFGLIDLAGLAASGALVDGSHIVLRHLASEAGETAALAMMRDGTLTYVAQATADSVVAAQWHGREIAMHATSTGKVMLAYARPDDLRLLLRLPSGGRLRRYTSTTITSLPALERELAEIRGRGYADCRGEFESTAWGVSAPVLDGTGRAVAVVSLWGPGERLTEDRFEELGRLAIAGADEIAGRRPEPG